MSKTPFWGRIMIAAWIFLLLAVAAGFLSYFGWMPQLSGGSDCSLDEGFSCEDYRVTSGGDISLNVVNELGDLSSVTLTLQGRPPHSECAGSLDFNFTSQGSYLGGGEALFDCGTISGDRFKAGLRVDYSAGGQNGTVLGRLTSEVE